MNDFSARDMKEGEMTGGIGPSKAKHVASAPHGLSFRR